MKQSGFNQLHFKDVFNYQDGLRIFWLGSFLIFLFLILIASSKFLAINPKLGSIIFIGIHTL